MARIVIADAGPLIAFAGVDALAVLQNLFSSISIVESVRRECLRKPGIDGQRIKAAIEDGWLDVPSKNAATEPLSPGLSVGESDAIRFALKFPDEALLIVDDRLARRFALKQSINIVGTVRILDLAEQRGLIKSAEQCIGGMAANGYRISVDLLRQIRSL